jgi:ankyrin repeat protein
MFYELLSPKSWRSPSASQQAALLKLLIDRKIDVNAKLDSDGTTPLMLAAVRGNSDAVQQLLLAGADAGRKNANGQTALTLARAVKKPQPGHPAVIQLLAPLTH